MSDNLLSANIGKRRTFAIISHPDAGKTTITEKLLLCTCLCLNEKLNHGVNEFLKIYNPVKPFYTFHSEKKFLAKIFASHDVRRISY